MNNYIIPAYLLTGAFLLMMVLGLIASILVPSLDRWSRKFFISYYFILLLCMIFFTIDEMIYMNPDLTIIEKIAVFWEYVLLSFPAPMMTAFLLHLCGENHRHNHFFRISAALWCIYIALNIIAQFNTVFYYVSDDNLFHRGPFHFIIMITYNAINIINLILLINKRKILTRKIFYAFLLYLIPLTIIMIIHTFVYVIVFIAVGVTISSFIMFIFLLSDQVDKYAAQQREITEQQAKIMVLQMRPHFIYNTMTSIYYLCEQDPKKAQQITLDFTTYLRKNFNAIVSEELITFKEELEHTRAYLAVEQIRFEDKLFVEFDIDEIQFHLPPLTLQPIVENAVKHGMDPEADPLHIQISTKETNTGYEIIVKDDGSGFEPVNKSEPHITMDNIKQRLQMMCKGTMSVTSHKDEGTEVKITIPGK
ncbi:MAG: histidine kinase [Lachnospiraceae bacterium]|nr:histidine kinase [Lachnospiraceae bacterium]